MQVESVPGPMGNLPEEHIEMRRLSSISLRRDAQPDETSMQCHALQGSCHRETAGKY